MVRQPYMTRLVLGRSAYEPPQWQDGERLQDEESTKIQEDVDELGRTNLTSPEEYVQHYDTRGHPENRLSRSLARRARRAQNDILTTVGVCVFVDKNGRRIPLPSEDPKNNQIRKNEILSVISESEFGFWLGAAEGSLWPLLMNGFGALRLRLETFGIYSGVSLVDILRIEWHTFGALKWLFTGIVADFSYELLDAGRSVLIEEAREALLKHFASAEVPENRRKRVTSAIVLFSYLWVIVFLHSSIVDLYITRLDITSFIIISPLEILKVLQHLDLIPAGPLFRTLRIINAASLSPMLCPALPSQWSLRTFVGFAIGTCISPLPLLLGIHYFDRRLDTLFLRYARIVVPRPDFPDEISKSAYDAHPTNLDAWSIELNNGQKSLLGEIKSDLGVAIDHVERLRARFGLTQVIGDIRRFFSVSREEQCCTTDMGCDNIPGATTVGGSPVSRITTADRGSDHQQSQGSSSLPLTGDDATGTSNTAGRRESRSTATPSPQLTASTDEEELMMRALEQDNPVQITTSAGSTDTLHMNVEVNGASPGEPVFTSSFSASPRPTIVETVVVQHVEEQRHRVTALSLQASESISLRIVYDLSLIFRLPLEALLVRTIAQNFLASASSSSGNASLARLRSSVYPRNTWFGAGLTAGGLSGVCDYASKMILCLGMESAVGLYVWQVAVAVAWCTGKRWYRWGTL
ncbi:hypothetical protein MMC26_006530 [Xylographa opegraphella]|nr:hypothetical protein [Xylographa opegraphella]